MFYCLKTSIREKYTKMLLPLSSFKHRRKGKQRGIQCFFYVSSSEWNLYRFITKFTEIHKLPKAVLLLKNKFD
jgi:hypothetical protein